MNTKLYYVGKKIGTPQGDVSIVITVKPIMLLDANTFLYTLGHHCVMTFGDVSFVAVDSLCSKDIDPVIEILAKPYEKEDIKVIYAEIDSENPGYLMKDITGKINEICNTIHVSQFGSTKDSPKHPLSTKKIINKTFFDPKYFVKGSAYRLYFKDGIIPSEVLTAGGVTEIDAILFEKFQPEDSSEILIFQYLYDGEFFNLKASADAYRDNMVHIVRLVPSDS